MRSKGHSDIGQPILNNVETQVGVEVSHTFSKVEVYSVEQGLLTMWHKLRSRVFVNRR